MSTIRINCPFCKAPVEISSTNRPDVQCTHCSKVWRLPPPAMNVEYGWYFIDRKKPVGPISREKLQKRAQARLLKPADMIRQEGNQKWQEVRSVSGLFPAPAHSFSFSRKKRWAWLAGSAAVVLLAALLLIGQMSSRNRVHKPDTLSPQVAAKTKKAETGLAVPKKQDADKSKKLQSPASVKTKIGEKATAPLADASAKQEIQRYILGKSGKQVSKSAPPKEFLTDWCRNHYDGCKNDQKLLYARIAEHLLVADDQFLISDDREKRRKGTTVAVAACTCAIYRIKDPWLATKIAEEYLLANLDVGNFAWELLPKESILETAVSAYALAQDTKKLLETNELLLLHASNRNTADACRLRLAKLHDYRGEYEEALVHLRAVSPTEGVGGARRLIPEIEKKAASKKPQGASK